MKRYILTLLAIGMVLPAFAFDFNRDKLEIDAGIKAGITSIINEKAEETIRMIGDKRNSDNEIVSAIKEEMGLAMRQIERNTKLRKNIFTRSFVKEQQIQKERYQNMLKWDIPSQIYEYIEINFDLSKMQNPTVVCMYHNETGIEVRFTYKSHYVMVSYNYNKQGKNITHIIE